MSRPARVAPPTIPSPVSGRSSSPTGSRHRSERQHFERIAVHYARLRGDEAYLRPIVEAITEAGDLAGRTVLEVGCGSGLILSELKRRGVRGIGVDRSHRMVHEARQRLPLSVGLVVGDAEALPLADASVDRVGFVQVVHLVDRPRAFREARRVLRAQGRVVIGSTDPQGVGESWAARFFPSWEEIDGARLPGASQLGRELAAAGFEEIRVEELRIPRSFPRGSALDRIRGRAFSTFAWMDEDEYRAGLRAAEASLPEVVRYDLRLLIVRARPRGAT